MFSVQLSFFIVFHRVSMFSSVVLEESSVAIENLALGASKSAWVLCVHLERSFVVLRQTGLENKAGIF